MVTPKHYQCVTAPHVYEIPCQPQELIQIQNLIQGQKMKLPRLRPNYIQEMLNITTVQQSPAYTEIKTVRPIKEILKHETMLDNKINPGTSGVVQNTANLMNNKYPTPERQNLEKEIENYVKNGATLTPKDTINFYENAVPIVDSAIKNPQMYNFYIVNYKMISAETTRLAKKLRGVFTFK